jgi:hypothetical protein
MALLLISVKLGRGNNLNTNLPSLLLTMPPRTPPRPDASLDPDLAKPSVWGGVFLWISFILPMIFVWWAYQSVAVIVLLFIIRIFIMFIPNIREVFGWVPKKSVVVSTGKIAKVRKEREVVVPIEEPVIEPRAPSVLLEELRSEVNWVLEKLHLRNAKEEERLVFYRKFRGWG